MAKAWSLAVAPCPTAEPPGLSSRGAGLTSPGRGLDAMVGERSRPWSPFFNSEHDKDPRGSQEHEDLSQKLFDIFSRQLSDLGIQPLSATRTHGQPITVRSNSSWPGPSAPVIKTSKTLNRSRSPHISKSFNAGPGRPRSNSTWLPSGCCFPGLPKKECWP